MAKKYPLERLLRIRRVQEDQAAASLAVSARRADQAQARVLKAEQEMLGITLEGDHTHAVWKTLIASKTAGRSMVSEAIAVAQTAAQQREERTEEYKAAHQDVAILEKLEEKHVVEQQHAEDRAEAAVVDEIATTRHRHKEDSHEL
ncbi:flagellar export protein FliJ [Timonella sp. A28]|uniref:flagellar export protein FliJ n=1 Tax=Timonella sp. A28 TaxID=3442640 RepID=UPI003EBBCED1